MNEAYLLAPDAFELEVGLIGTMSGLVSQHFELKSLLAKELLLSRGFLLEGTVNFPQEPYGARAWKGAFIIHSQVKTAKCHLADVLIHPKRHHGASYDAMRVECLVHDAHALHPS